MRKYQVKSLTIDTGFGPVTMTNVPIYLHSENVPDELGEGDYVLDLPTLELAYLEAATRFTKTRKLVDSTSRDLTTAEKDAIADFCWVYGKILTTRMNDHDALDALVNTVGQYRGRA